MLYGNELSRLSTGYVYPHSTNTKRGLAVPDTGLGAQDSTANKKTSHGFGELKRLEAENKQIYI